MTSYSLKLSLILSCLCWGVMFSETEAGNRSRSGYTSARQHTYNRSTYKSTNRTRTASSRYSSPRSNRSSYAQKNRLYEYNTTSKYPLSTGKRRYDYNLRDYTPPTARIDRSKQPLGSPYRSMAPYPYYYPWRGYYGFYPYAAYHFYRIPWYSHYNYRYYHDFYRPYYATPYAY